MTLTAILSQSLALAAAKLNAFRSLPPEAL
jgi:hypothetical protein